MEVMMTPKTLMMKEIRTFVFEGLRVPVCPITSIKISISGEAALAAGFASTHTTQPMSFDRNMTNAIIIFSKKGTQRHTFDLGLAACDTGLTSAPLNSPFEIE